MGFSIGDKVMHPRFGAGQITGETHRELVKGFEHYFVIAVAGTAATAYVPIHKMDELGVRRVMSRSTRSQVLETLRSKPRALANEYKLRQERIQEKLGTRLPISVAEAVRDLTWRQKLTQHDGVLLSRGRELLASEMALATDTQVTDAQEFISSVLSAAMANGFDEPESSAGDVAAPRNTREKLFQGSVLGFENA